MKLFSPCLAFLFFIVAPVSRLLAQPDTASITPSARIELFNGKGLAGWAFVSKSTNAPAESIWSVTNGVITCLGRPNGYARTLSSYRNYQLHAEWRFPAGPGNSGLFLHLNQPDQVWPLCFEAQLLSGSAGEVRLNGGAQLTSLADPKAKSVPHQQPSSERPPGEWNTCDIACYNHTIAIRVNDVLQNEVTGTSVDSGAIGLQAEGKPVEFRNIYLAPLPATAPIK